MSAEVFLRRKPKSFWCFTANAICQRGAAFNHNANGIGNSFKNSKPLILIGYTAMKSSTLCFGLGMGSESSIFG